MVLGRLSPGRFSAMTGWYPLLALLATACSLWGDPIQVLPVDPAIMTRSPWTNDLLAAAEQWLVLLFGLGAVGLFFDAAPDQHQPLNPCGFRLFIVGGLMLVAQAHDFLALGMSLEIVSLATRGLWQCPRDSVTAQRGASDAIDETLAMDETLVTHETLRRERSPAWLHWLASGWMWFGMALFTAVVQTTQYDAIQRVLVDAYHPADAERMALDPSHWLLLAAGLIILSLLGRMSLVPFSLGTGFDPQRRSVLSTGFALLAGHLAGSIALVRLIGQEFAGLGQQLVVVLMVVSLASFLLTIILVVRGFSPGLPAIPRWLTALLLLHGSWLCVGFMPLAMELESPAFRWGALPGQTETLSLIVFSQFASLLALIGALGILGHLARSGRDIQFLEELKGLGQVAPWAAVALLFSLASSIGLPWTAGFWGRWLMILSSYHVHIKSTSSISTPQNGIRFAVLIGMIATTFMAMASIRLAREMFLESPLARSKARGAQGPLIAGLIAAMMTLVLGVVPQALLVPMRSMNSPREVQPEGIPQGSGKNPSAFRSDFHSSGDFSE